MGLTTLGDNTECSLYVFELYVSGMTLCSLKTIKTVKAILEADLSGKYHLEIVDVFKNPQRAQKMQIMATPTLIKKSPQPQRAIVGDIAGRARIIGGLNLWSKNNHV